MRLWALLRDTWWQTRFKVVFLILPILLALSSLSLIFIVSFEGTGPDEDLVVEFAGHDVTGDLLNGWAQQERAVRAPSRTMREMQAEMADDRLARDGETGSEEDEAEREAEREARAERRKELYARYRAEAGITRAGAVVSVIQGTFAGGFLFTLAMLFFIFGAATILPDTLAAGTVDLLVSKPVDRLRIYLGKYLGGLLIIACNLAIFVGLTFAILTVKSGYANWRYFQGALMVLFAFAVLNAILHFFGVLLRSSVFSILMGYAFYIIFDTGIEALHSFVVLEIFSMPEWLQTTINVAWYILPNFSSMKASTVHMVMGVTIVDWTPLWTSGLFGLVLLGWGYWIFRRKEY